MSILRQEVIKHLKELEEVRKEYFAASFNSLNEIEYNDLKNRFMMAQTAAIIWLQTLAGITDQEIREDQQ